MQQGKTEYLSAAQTAALMRKALKKEFAGVKFAVKIRRKCVDVKWIDGPAEEAVKAVVEIFAGSRFDGMIDLKYHADHWLHPDGTVELASIYGHGMGYDEVIQAYAPVEGAVKVKFLVDFVFTERTISEEFVRKVEAESVPCRGIWRQGYAHCHGCGTTISVDQEYFQPSAGPLAEVSYSMPCCTTTCAAKKAAQAMAA